MARGAGAAITSRFLSSFSGGCGRSSTRAVFYAGSATFRTILSSAAGARAGLRRARTNARENTLSELKLEVFAQKMQKTVRHRQRLETLAKQHPFK